MKFLLLVISSLLWNFSDANVQQMARTTVEAFDSLLDAYEKMAKYMPLLGDYGIHLETDVRGERFLEMVFQDIFEFHHQALELFKKSCKANFSSSHTASVLNNLQLGNSFSVPIGIDFKRIFSDFLAIWRITITWSTNKQISESLPTVHKRGRRPLRGSAHSKQKNYFEEESIYKAGCRQLTLIQIMIDMFRRDEGSHRVVDGSSRDVSSVSGSARRTPHLHFSGYTVFPVQVSI